MKTTRLSAITFLAFVFSVFYFTADAITNIEELPSWPHVNGEGSLIQANGRLEEGGDWSVNYWNGGTFGAGIYQVQINLVNTPTANGPGFYWRANTLPDNGETAYLLLFDRAVVQNGLGTVWLAHYQNGNATALATNVYATRGPVDVRIEDNAQTIKVYLNNALFISTPAVSTATGFIGVNSGWGSGTWFDNISFDGDANAPINDNLLACFPFTGNANDASGNGHNGTAHGATLTTDRFGNPNSAYQFDANSNYISVASSGALSFNASSDSYTISLWARLDGYTNRWGDLHVLSDRPYGVNNASSYGLAVQAVSGPISGLFANTLWNGNTSGKSVSSTSPLGIGQWYALTLVVKANETQTLFVNGFQVASGNISGIGNTAGNTGDIMIGAAWYPDGHDLQVFNGALDDIRIYNRALSAGEVAQLYNPSGSVLGFDYCLPESQAPQDWNNTVSYVMRVYESSGSGTAGASITVTNGLTGQTYTTTTNSTDASGIVTIPITVPSGQADGTYDISFTATKPGYFSSATLHRSIQVQHVAPPTNFGVTVIAHGYQRGTGNAESWMSELGCAILRRATRGKLWRFEAGTDTLTNITTAYTQKLIGVIPDSSGEQVIIVRWEPTANNTPIGQLPWLESAAGEAEAVGHQVYSLLMGGDARGVHGSFVGPVNARLPLHLIGHSFGTVVISEAIQRLGIAGVQVEQMTTLDPHDWDEEFVPVDGEGLLPDVHVWSNVLRADNYYEDCGGVVVPHGRDIFGANNFRLSALSGFCSVLSGKEHGRPIWFYLATIDTSRWGTETEDGRIEDFWKSETMGYPYTRLGGHHNLSAFDAPNTDRNGGDSLTPPPSNSTRTNSGATYPGQWDISFDPPADVFNGGFDPKLFNESEAFSWKSEDEDVPGYSTPIVVDQLTVFHPTEISVELSGDSDARELKTHLTYVPANAATLIFDLNGKIRSISGNNDRLVVSFNNVALGTNPATMFPASPTTLQYDISAFAGHSGLISLKLEPDSGTGGDQDYGSEAVVDNIKFGYQDLPSIAVYKTDTAIQNGQLGSVDFGNPVQSSEVQLPFTIQNIGGGTLTLSAIHVPTGFSIVGTPPASLSAGASGSFYIQMDTSTVGSKSGNVTFTCNDSAQSSFSFPVSGQVIAPSTPPAIALSVSGVSIANGQTSPVISIGSALISSTGPIQVFTIQNNGDQALTIGTPTLPPGFTLASAPPASLPSGQSATFGVQLDTGTTGTPFGDVSIPNSDSTKNPFTFRISGSVVQPTGNITVTLNPAQAVSAGAQWRLDGSAWQTNGAMLSGLGTSNHIVEFKELPYWHAPSTATVSLAAGQSRNITRYYVPFSQPVLGQIGFLPSRSVQGSVSGDGGVPIIVERSMDLQSWSPISTNSAGSFNFYDYAANGNPQLFYRARYE